MGNSTELRKYTCVICSKVCSGFGNNPFPIKNSGECCNTCNAIKVIPERISLYRKEKSLDTSKDMIKYADNGFEFKAGFKILYNENLYEVTEVPVNEKEQRDFCKECDAPNAICHKIACSHVIRTDGKRIILKRVNRE